MTQSNHRTGLLVTILGAALLGFAGIFVRWSAPASPVMVGFYRMLFALPGLLILAWRSPKREGVTPEAERRGTLWAIAAGLCFTGDLWTWHAAMNYTTVANATLLVGLAPLWVALISVAFMSVRLRKRFWAGLLLALAGALVLGFAKGARWGTGRGELLGGIASIWYAVFTLAIAKARTHLSALMALLWVVITCLIGFGLIGAVQGAAFSGFPPRAWLALAGLGLVVQVLAWWLITWGLGHISASLGSVGLLTQAIATVLLGWMLLSEPVKPLQGLGAGLILAGIAMAALAPPVPKFKPE